LALSIANAPVNGGWCLNKIGYSIILEVEASPIMFQAVQTIVQLKINNYKNN
jgi:hypothetical protein